MLRSGRVMSLTFLIYPCEEDPRRFVAHCLEMDVLAVGDTRPKAILLLKELTSSMGAPTRPSQVRKEESSIPIVKT